jgi:phage tail-like protein
MVTAKTMRTDPLRNFKFRVQIIPKSSTGNLSQKMNQVSELGFAQVSGISVTNEIITYREGGMNTHPHKMVAQSDFAPVSFARGAFSGQDQLFQWQKFLHAWLGNGVGGEAGLSVGDQEYRCDILVKVYDHPHTASEISDNSGNSSLFYQYDGGAQGTSGKPIVPGNVKFQFKLFNAWPGAYALTDLNAGDNGILIQSMTVHHEGFYIDWNGTQDLASL